MVALFVANSHFDVLGGEEKEITFVEETIDKGPDSSFSVWKQQR